MLDLSSKQQMVLDRALSNMYLIMLSIQKFVDARQISWTINDFWEDIESRFAHCVDLLQVGGHFYLRANPGITHKTGPYVDVFPWTFEIVNEFAEKYNLKLNTFKKDANDRLYFVYTKK